MQSDDSYSTAAGARNNQSQGFRKTPKIINYKSFKELFQFEENDRDKKEMKKDYKRIEKEHKGKIKFKHLIGKII